MIPSPPDAWRSRVDWLRPSLDPLRTFLMDEYRKHVIYPPADQLFSAFALTPPDQVKTIILGQDPYHGADQAHGLAFSVRPGIRPPASLVNIFKELKSDVGVSAPPGLGDLSPWARQGVLLLNTALTVRAGRPLSHRNKGWEIFSDEVLRAVNDGARPVAFVLWGHHAQQKKPLIDAGRHLIIESAHPSPLSARNGFFGSKPFSRINEALNRWGHEPIDWRLDLN